MFDIPYDKLIQLAMQMDPSAFLEQLDQGGGQSVGQQPPFAPGGQSMAGIMNPGGGGPQPQPQQAPPPFVPGAWQAESGTMMPPLGLVEGEQGGIPTQSTAPFSDKQLALLAGMMPKVEPVRSPGFIGVGGGSRPVQFDPLIREALLRRGAVPSLAQILGAR